MSSSASVAQLVEQRTLNPLVQGSSPCGGTKQHRLIQVLPLPVHDVAAENGVKAWFEVLPRPSHQPVILCSILEHFLSFDRSLILGTNWIRRAGCGYGWLPGFSGYPVISRKHIKCRLRLRTGSLIRAVTSFKALICRGFSGCQFRQIA